MRHPFKLDNPSTTNYFDDLVCDWIDRFLIFFRITKPRPVVPLRDARAPEPEAPTEVKPPEPPRYGTLW